MRLALFGFTLLVALAAASPAAAGCWATVGLAPPPANTTAGQVWSAELTVLQHGRNPLPDAANARPTVTIVNETTGERKTFAAKVTDASQGRYTAEVVFPASGVWSYRVFDGFTSDGGGPVPCARTHTFASVDIDGAAAGGGGGTSPPWGLVASVSALTALALAGAVVLGVRRRRVASRAAAA
jgi:hypothetical protein